MKRRTPIAFLLACMLTGSIFSIHPAHAQEDAIQSQLKRMETTLDSLRQRIRALELEKNRLTYENFIESQFEKPTTFPIYALSGVNVNYYNRTVDSLREYRNEFTRANDRLQWILMKDKQFSKLKKEEEQMLDKDTRANFTKAYHAIYRRLEVESEEYREARREREAALGRSNLALLKHIFAEYRRNGKILPTNIISNLKTLEQQDFRIVELNSALEQLGLLLRQREYAYYRLRYPE